jgi:predicted nucleic-acid-binding protein
MQKVDANVVLRYLLDDNIDMSPKAKAIIDNFAVEVPVEVLCEVVFILHGYYDIDRQNIRKELTEFFNKTQCVLAHREAILKGLEYYGKTSLDFVDCILAGYTEIENDEITTFDNKLRKLIAKIKSANAAK